MLSAAVTLKTVVGILDLSISAGGVKLMVGATLSIVINDHPAGATANETFPKISINAPASILDIILRQRIKCGSQRVGVH